MGLALRLLRRALASLVVVVGVVELSFLVATLLPGDPARMLAGPQASSQDVARIRAAYGLDEPIGARHTRFLKRLVHPASSGAAAEHRSCSVVGLGLHLDLGYSASSHRKVADLLAARIPRSFELALAALFLQLVLGSGAGIFAAWRRGTHWDQAATGAALLAASAPTFVLGVALQYVFAHRLHLLPYDGYGTTPAEHLASLVLPAGTLGLYGAALYARVVRDEVVGLLGQDFVKTVRAKGASEARVLFVHALRNALAPIATLAALDFGALVGGAIVTETLFRWPGVGQLAVDALLNRDGPVIVATVLFTSTAVVGSMFALDLVLAALDPRARASR